MSLKKIAATFVFSLFAVLPFSTAMAQAAKSGTDAKDSFPTAQQMDALWEKRDDSGAQIKALVADLIAKEASIPQDFEILYRVSMLAYYDGFYVSAKEPNKKKLEIFSLGVKAGDRARQVKPDRVEGHYWYAVNQGGYGLTKGIMASLSAAEPMRQALDNVIKIEPKYMHAGGYRVRGRLYFKLPGGFISFGDNKKALADLTKAVEIAPEHRLSYVYLAQVQAKLESKEVALKTLEKAKKLPDIAGKAEEAAAREELAKVEADLK